MMTPLYVHYTSIHFTSKM